VLSAESYGHGHDTFEKEILVHLRDTDHSQLGHNYMCHLIEDSKHEGPNGTHACFIFELMGETLRSFGAWFKDNMIPESVMRRFIIQLALALDYAHDVGVVHTGQSLPRMSVLGPRSGFSYVLMIPFA
jgi:serine/threonine-protein kinase SRPK3